MVKRQILVLSIGIGVLNLLVLFCSCKKINQATELGGGLVPAVDNVHTFEVALTTVTQNKLFIDTNRVLYNDLLALGDFDDPEFGHTHATIDFNVTPSAFG